MTTREDRQPDPAVDRDRAIAALIYCAKKHPDKTLGQLIHNAIAQEYQVPPEAWEGASVHPQHIPDAEMTAAFHSYAKEPA